MAIEMSHGPVGWHANENACVRENKAVRATRDVRPTGKACDTFSVAVLLLRISSIGRRREMG